MANTRRLGALLFGLAALLLVVLCAFSAPTEPVGDAGWAIAAVVTGAVAGFAVVLRRTAVKISWTGLLIASYATVTGIGVMQWLDGGTGAPDDILVLLMVIFVAAIQPPRRIVPFMLFSGIVMAAPFVYDAWDSDAAASATVRYLMWWVIAVLASLMMMGVRAQRLAHAREEANARQEARLDTLTGLHNRRAFDEMLNLEVKRARRLRLPLCMAMVDIENFKEINDRWSYLEGDRCLREVATTVQGALRDPDLCFRWGGDEFAVILSGTSASDAGPLGERVRNEVGAACRRPDQEPIRVRFAAAELRDGVALDELVEMAGLALTAAKTDAER